MTPVNSGPNARKASVGGLKKTTVINAPRHKMIKRGNRMNQDFKANLNELFDSLTPGFLRIMTHLSKGIYGTHRPETSDW